MEEKTKNKGSKQNTEPKNDELRELVKSLISEEIEGAKASFKKDFETRVTAEREDAAKLATMSAEERAKFEMDKKQKDFEAERQQYVSERAQFEAAKELSAQNLPVNFASMVADADKDKMLEKISVFKSEYLKAIEAGISDRLKGKLPSVSKEIPKDGDPFLNGLGM